MIVTEQRAGSAKSTGQEPQVAGEGRSPRPAQLTRRGLLHGAAGLGVALGAGMLAPAAVHAAAAGAAAGPVAGGVAPAPAAEFAAGLNGAARLDQALAVRLDMARRTHGLGAAAQRSNGDEERLPGLAACYSKGLPHDRTGAVDRQAYEVLLAALRSGRPADFEQIPLGGFVKLANPQAAWAFEPLGPDSCQTSCPPAPLFDGAEQAAELTELYWQAVARDVAFADYDVDPLATRAAEDLSRLSGFRGPRREGRIDGATLFRGSTAGDLTGPYVSQFLQKTLPLTPIAVEQRIRTAVPGLDYLTSFDGWLAIQNGALAGINRFDPKPRYIRSGRDLGEYVHRDFSFQPYLTACLAALKMGTPPGGANPYKHSRTQSGFATFGQPYLLYAVAAVSQAGLDACWFQKWRVHRRLRPEEMAGRVEARLRGLASHAFHPDLLSCAAIEEVRRRHASALLPQAYPEGCPTHPSYPAGHAVIAGACVSALKALLDVSYVIPQPVVASADGLRLLPYRGPDLTVGGELDKLASNIAIGRNFAGLHWRTDASAGLALGEAVAIHVLTELKSTGNEVFCGWSLRCFDGKRVTV
jgi:membrane-associated phospholipid phosphatase